ncbi:hypothetical protein BDW02DRAFT_288673 [Decorospora gaudefroyi]|uniref:Rhodopsin domain-containing protein n=1 Tax=Decorospora gaudefroyi TaxID=184978 RepID=A0A6A5KDS6_9PLEO|nr:hypothetical protein BDW02DRAFT_288673 [Decorospora gaudefroyi]
MVNQVILSDSNRTPIVQIVTWFTLVTSLLAFCTHAGIKYYVFRSLTTESWVVLTSLVFCVAQSAAVSLQAHYGFGKPMASLSEYNVEAALKSGYAATILLIISLGFSKLAIVAFIYHLTPSGLYRKINHGITTVVILWLVCSVLVAAFECHPPHAWDRRLDRCIDRSTWWNAVSVFNILTEVTIVALEIGIMVRLQVTRQRKAGIISLFAFRLLVLVAIAIQLGFFNREAQDAALKEDLMLGYWRSTICNQIVQCLAIVTTCLPYTKLFMEGFESGLMRLDDLRRRGEHTYGSSKEDSKGYQLMDISRSGRSERSKNSGPSRPEENSSIQVSKSWAVQVEPVDSVSAHTTVAQ